MYFDQEPLQGFASVLTTAKHQGNKPSVNTRDKDHIAKIVAEVKFVSTAREDQDVFLVMGTRFVNTIGKDQNAKIMVGVEFVSTTR